MKSLKELALPITEEEYRNDGCMHYSTLTSYERGGFHSIPTLEDRKESPSLTFGSVVDCLITGSQEEFDNTYFYADFPEISDQIATIVKGLYECYKDTADSIDEVPDNAILATMDNLNFGKSWYPATRLKKVREPGKKYYELLKNSENKILISSEMYNDAMACVEALKTAKSTAFLFANPNPFEPEVERLYQLKFRIYVKKTINSPVPVYDIISDNRPAINNELLKKGYIPYTIMADEILVLHKEKKIFPIDLKTSSHYEDEFFKSFIDWMYHDQARLYSLAIKAAVEQDDYFKDFTMMNYSFIVVNKKTLCPMVWRYPDTYKMSTLYYGKNNQIECRHPFVIGEELKWYLDHPERRIPRELNFEEANDLIPYLLKL